MYNLDIVPQTLKNVCPLAGLKKKLLPLIESETGSQFGENEGTRRNGCSLPFQIVTIFYSSNKQSRQSSDHSVSVGQTNDAPAAAAVARPSCQRQRFWPANAVAYECHHLHSASHIQKSI